MRAKSQKPPPHLALSMDQLIQQTRDTISGALTKLSENMLEITDIEEGEDKLNERLAELMDKEAWSIEEAIELSALTFICAYLMETDEEAEDET
jgi:hypothetical protein